MGDSCDPDADNDGIINDPVSSCCWWCGKFWKSTINSAQYLISVLLSTMMMLTFESFCLIKVAFLQYFSNNSEAGASELLEKSWRNDYLVTHGCWCYQQVQIFNRTLLCDRPQRLKVWMQYRGHISLRFSGNSEANLLLCWKIKRRLFVLQIYVLMLN